MVSWMASVLVRFPGRILAGFIVLHTVIFAAIALLCPSTLPLDVIEQIGWARDPQWVYFKHPPGPAWVLHGLLTLSGQRLWPAAIVGPVCVGLSFWITWLLARRLLDPVRATLAVLLLEGVRYVNFSSLEFNHNLIQMPLWSAIALFGHRAWRSDRWFDWIALGVFCGLGMYGKYSSILLIAAVIAALATDAEARRRFGGFGPWLGLAAAVATILPHLRALYRIDFRPFWYPMERAAPPADWFDHVRNPLLWSGGQLANVACLLILFLLLVPIRRTSGTTAVPAHAVETEDRRYVYWIAFGPVIATVILGIVGGRALKEMWGAPMPGFLGLALMAASAGRGIDVQSLRRFWPAFAAVLVLATTITAVNASASPWIFGKGDRAHFPARALDAAVRGGWTRLSGDRPMRIVIADSWLAGLLSAYDVDHPSVMIDGDREKSPWIGERRLAEDGAVILWRADREQPDANDLAGRFPGSLRQPPLTLPYDTKFRVPPVTIGWAILPPRSEPR